MLRILAPFLLLTLHLEVSWVYVIENEGSKLFLVTDLNAPNKKLLPWM